MKSHRNVSLIFIAVLLLAGCASAPLDYPKEPSVALVDTDDGREAQKISEWLDGRKDVNGFYPLTQGFDAFGVRLGLMSVAEYSIDAQYFLMSYGHCPPWCPVVPISARKSRKTRLIFSAFSVPMRIISFWPLDSASSFTSAYL